MQTLAPQGNALEEAFKALVDIVATFESSGRTLRSAAIKVALQLKLPSFDQRDLGFESFRAFLKAAESRGHVRLVEAAKGPDIDVLPANGNGQDGPSLRADRIRSDVWKAFTRWGDDYLRFWDPDEKRAYWIRRFESPGDRSADAVARKAYESDPSKFVPIECIPPETVKGWMTDFTEERRPGLPGDALVPALSSPKPFHEFTQLVRRLGLGSQWHETYAGNVRRVIEEWAEGNGLTVNLNPSAAPVSHEPTERILSRNIVNIPESEPSIREAAHLLIDRMTLPELLELKISLRLLIQH